MTNPSVYSVEVVDSLALLTHKVASNVFDLSSGLTHVSIRDQIVRAQLLVRDLCRGDRNCKTILIVGAGVAGIAAAMMAHKLVRQVVVLETQPKPFSLFRGITSRHVGPFMYEWPSPFHGDQSYPPTATAQWGSISAHTPAWQSLHPLPADSLAQELLAWLSRQWNPTKPDQFSLRVGVSAGIVKDFVRKFAQREGARSLARLCRRTLPPTCSLDVSPWDLWPPGASPVHAPDRVQPDYVLLAAGMGRENVKLLPADAKPNFVGARFWANDTLMNRPASDDFVTSVFGGGDGALQDVLRLLTAYDHPLQFLAFLEGDAGVRAGIAQIMPALLSIERQGRLYSSWTQTPDAYALADTACRDIASRLAHNPDVRVRVGHKLNKGQGKVLHYVRASHFGKAYLLNRFLVHLIDECQRLSQERWAGRMRYKLHFNHHATGYGQGTTKPHRICIHNSSAIEVDQIVVRYGMEKGSVPGAQMIQISPKKSLQRTTLARVDLPFVAQS